MTGPQHIEIGIETPLSGDMRAMIGELSELLLSLTPADACHHLAPEDMANDRTTVFVARVDGAVAACGALYRHGGGVAEVKRMYTCPAFQGLGLAKAVLSRIIELAEQEGAQRIVLETGHNYAAARKLYEQFGFEPCGPVLDYPPHPESVFYSKQLTAA
ncbi:N-acetyltransferase [Roseibium aquae]|uniref:N-acetyltransferase n=1 Tax=Roseibium aquae TaxID=1323746 RepID=A0A916TPR9_9HYPH|nr:GNAT family N-acetyltransferase [Roseibium aquae]GGB58891.1 N-acetyltransferase [Roseibium aquae]